MLTNIGLLLSSVRFWILSLTAIISILQGMPVLDVLQVWAAAVVTVGSADSVAKKLGGK